MQVEMIISYLELNDPSQFVPAETSDPDFKTKKMGVQCPEINKFFYNAIGTHYDWIDKIYWSDEKWNEYGTQQSLQTLIGYYKQTPAGYCEIDLQDNNVEIVYFGLLEQFIGKGLGGIFLSQVIEYAWNTGAERVWLHTCNLDHPAALKNYKARGMRLYKTEKEFKEIENK